MAKDLKLDLQKLRKTVLILRAIHHPVRKDILGRLRKKTERSVTDLYKDMQLEQSVASQHLAILRRTGVLKTRREGKNIYYSIDSSRANEINSMIDHILYSK